MIIETKFDIGDTLLFSDYGTPTKESCPLCKTTGRVEIGKDMEYKKFYDCPECKGTGYNSKLHEETKEGLVTLISVEVYSDGSKRIQYRRGYFEDYLPEEEIIGKKI